MTFFLGKRWFYKAAVETTILQAQKPSKLSNFSKQPQGNF